MTPHQLAEKAIHHALLKHGIDPNEVRVDVMQGAIDMLAIEPAFVEEAARQTKWTISFQTSALASNATVEED